LHQGRITGCQTIHTVTLKILGSLYFSSGVGQPKIFGGISILRVGGQRRFKIKKALPNRSIACPAFPCLPVHLFA